MVQLLKNDSKATAVKVEWDELLKIAQIGDTVKQHRSQFDIGRKEFVQGMDNLYEMKLFGTSKYPVTPTTGLID